MSASSIVRKFAAVVTVGAFGAVFASTVFAGNVTETKPECQNATALLLGGTNENADNQMSRIRSFFENKKVWTVGSAKPGVSGEVGLVSYDVAYPAKGGPTQVFGCECGAGGTCNEVAKAFAAVNPDSAPMVFCGETVMLTNKR